MPNAGYTFNTQVVLAYLEWFRRNSFLKCVCWYHWKARRQCMLWYAASLCLSATVFTL